MACHSVLSSAHPIDVSEFDGDRREAEASVKVQWQGHQFDTTVRYRTWNRLSTKSVDNTVDETRIWA